MAFCSKCGAEVGQGAGFCPKCGAPQAAAAAPSSPSPAGGSTTVTSVESGLQENIAGLLCYALGWLTGIIFFLVDKRPFVRFHAAQSIVVFGGLNVLRYLLGHFFGLGFAFGGWGWNGFGAGVLLYELVGLVSFILWILLMIKAAQHEKFRVPVAADFADQLAGK
jgi:uncharacterized membrane protein